MDSNYICVLGLKRVTRMPRFFMGWYIVVNFVFDPLWLIQNFGETFRSFVSDKYNFF